MIFKYGTWDQSLTVMSFHMKRQLGIFKLQSLSSWVLYRLQNARPFAELLLTQRPTCLGCSNCQELWKTISVFRREKEGKMRGWRWRRVAGWEEEGQMRAESYLEVTCRVKWKIILLLLYSGYSSFALHEMQWLIYHRRCLHCWIHHLVIFWVNRRSK